MRSRHAPPVFPPLDQGGPIDRSRRARSPTPYLSHHLLALRRGFFFAAAALALIAPMALAARHADAELTLARCWPLDLSAPGPRIMAVPALRADSGLR